jgi:hypothetical protein
MYRPAKPLEELALDLLFESFGESRYNRTTAEYEYLSSMITGLKDAHYRVNKQLNELKESRWTQSVTSKPETSPPVMLHFPFRFRWKQSEMR